MGGIKLKKTNLELSPFKIILIYFIIGGLWIFLFDFTLFQKTMDAKLLSNLHIYEDVAYLVLTGGLLYTLISRHLRAVRRSEQALSESEAKFRMLFASASDAIFLGRVGEDGSHREFIEVNDAACRKLGYTREELCQMTSDDISDKEWLKHHRNTLLKARSTVAEKDHAVLEWRHMSKDGRSFPVEINGNGFYLNGERVVLSICRDMTERKEAERQLAESEQRYKSLFEHNTDAVFSCDLEGWYTSANPACEQIAGLSLEEFLGMHFTEVVLAEDHERVYGYFEKAIQGEAQSYELSIFHRDGHKVVLNVKNFPIYVDAKITGIYGIARDITESKRVEAALRESEAKYRLIAENTSDMIGVLDTNGIAHYSSPSHVTVLGYTLDYYQGRPVFDLVHPEDVPRVVAIFSEMIRTKRPREVECRYIKAGGDWVMLEVRGMPVLDEAGNVTTIVVVARDITGRRQTEEILRKSDKLSVVGQLAAGVAHEIRNPLTAIKGFVQLLNERNQDARTYYEIILSELDRIEFIISEFLVLAKPQSIKFQPKDIRTLLQAIIALLETQAIINNVQIVTDFAEDLPLIECEENQLKQVFINVLKNSIEAMPGGGEIRMQAVLVDDQVLIRIRDQGCGIPPERIRMLGEPFYTTKEKGTGLGLMVSYRIIEDHKGSIQIESELDQGTVVEVRLPVIEYAPA